MDSCYNLLKINPRRKLKFDVRVTIAGESWGFNVVMSLNTRAKNERSSCRTSTLNSTTFFLQLPDILIFILFAYFMLKYPLKGTPAGTADAYLSGFSTNCDRASLQLLMYIVRAL